MGQRATLTEASSGGDRPTLPDGFMPAKWSIVMSEVNWEFEIGQAVKDKPSGKACTVVRRQCVETADGVALSYHVDSGKDGDKLERVVEQLEVIE